MTSVLTVTLLGLSMGAGLDYGTDLKAQAIYLGNIVGILVGAVYLGKYWMKLSRGHTDDKKDNARDISFNGGYGTSANGASLTENRHHGFYHPLGSEDDTVQVDESALYNQLAA